LDEQGDIPPQKTLWAYFKEGIVRANARRPMSFYLLLSIPVVLLLAYGMFLSRNSPGQFAFYLSLLFLFFFVILHRALIDFVEIVRRHFREHESIFVALGERAHKGRDSDSHGNEQDRS
jgi:uncharacterized membrane protein YesL